LTIRIPAKGIRRVWEVAAAMAENEVPEFEEDTELIEAEEVDIDLEGADLDESESEEFEEDSHEAEGVRDEDSRTDEAVSETETETESEGQEAVDFDEPCNAARAEQEEINATLDSAYRRLAGAELQFRKEKRKASRLDVELEESELDLQEIQNAQQSLGEWVRARNGSFAWQLSDALAGERDKAQSARARAEQWLKTGRDQTIRLLLPVESKHRLWPRFGALMFLLVALVVFFQYMRNIRAFVWTQYIPTPWPMIGFATLVFIGLALHIWLKFERAYAASAISERWEKREELGIKGLDSGQHALALIDFVRRMVVPIPLLVALWFAIAFARDLVPTVVQSFIPQPWVIWLIMAVFYLFNVMGAWFSYYKFLSQLRFQLVNVLYEARRQGNAYRHAATEDARLEAMHSLVPDYLEMLGKPINTPWSVDMSQVKAGDMRPNGDTLPASVGLAEATGGDTRQWHVMENKSRGLLYRPGWITNAFRGILEEIADFDGINPRTLTADSVAADPGDSRRGQRKLVSEMSVREEILASTGRNQLRLLSEAIQKGVIREIKPLVTPLRHNELEHLDISTNRFELENADQVPWDEFLEQALSEAAPFSMLTFSPTGIDGRRYHVKESRALVPKDLTSVESSSKLKIVESEEGAHSTPLDMVVRIDRSDWLNPTDLLLFTGVQLPQAEISTEPSAGLEFPENVGNSSPSRIED
jgi:hypothetical protein